MLKIDIPKTDKIDPILNNWKFHFEFKCFVVLC